MQPTDILFSSISALTGGLITDLQTAMVGMITVAFILFGFDHLKDVFENSLRDRNRSRALDEAREYRKTVDNQYVDSAIRDVYKAKYRDAVRRAAK